MSTDFKNLRCILFFSRKYGRYIVATVNHKTAAKYKNRVLYTFERAEMPVAQTIQSKLNKAMGVVEKELTVYELL